MRCIQVVVFFFASFGAALLNNSQRTKDTFKFLVYSPQFANSHVNFLGKVSDVLVDAGHDVVMLSPIYDATIGNPGSKKARVIELPQTPNYKESDDLLKESGNVIWEKMDVFMIASLTWTWVSLAGAWSRACNDTIHYPGLIDQLRAEKFDVAYTEAIDFCSFGIFHLAGIKKVAVVHSMAQVDAMYYITQAPEMTSYVPTLHMASSYGEQMSFWQRIQNTAPQLFFQFGYEVNIGITEKVFRKFQPGFPSMLEIAGNTSLVFVNSEPLVDFPRLTNHKIIEIRGIVVSEGHGKLNKTWSDVFDLRPNSVLISFGTFSPAYRMREVFKQTIQTTVRKFPDVTFIWKYEKPEHNISFGIPNLIESTWVPQVDMLYDPRLSAFITHSGVGSITEASMAGVPMVVIPLGSDQLWNAQVVARTGAGAVLESKEELGEEGPLEEALRAVLNNDEYREKAARVATLLHNRPFKVRELLVKNMEFLAKYGPLRMLDHEGRNMTWFTFWSVDVFTFLALCAFSVLVFTAFILRLVFRLTMRMCRVNKTKME